MNRTRRDGVNPFLMSYMPRWNPSGDLKLGCRCSLVSYSARLFAFLCFYAREIPPEIIVIISFQLNDHWTNCSNAWLILDNPSREILSIYKIDLLKKHNYFFKKSFLYYFCKYDGKVILKYISEMKSHLSYNIKVLGILTCGSLTIEPPWSRSY